MKLVIKEEQLSQIIRKVYKTILEKKDPSDEILLEDCVKSKVQIDPKTGKSIYIDTKTQKPCSPPKKKENTNIKNLRNPKQIAEFLKNADSRFDDDEVGAEKAFSEIRTWDRYQEVKKYLGQDPYKFVKKYMDVDYRYGYYQSITASYKIITNKKPSYYNLNEFLNKCPINFTENTPGGLKQYLGPIHYLDHFWGNPGTPNADSNLYVYNPITKKNILSVSIVDIYKSGKILAKVPSDFGWTINTSTYPYPKYYSQSCIVAAKNIDYQNKKINRDRNQKEESRLKELRFKEKDLESTRFVNPIKVNSVIQTKIEKTNYYDLMTRFNQSLTKQRKLIPEYCTTPLERDDINRFRWANDFDFKFRKISMYTLCKDYGGLWVYGSDKAKLTCGCRDNTNPALQTTVMTDTGPLNTSEEIEKQESSRNFSEVEGRQILYTVGSLAAAFIPFVGPYLSAGIMLLDAKDYWEHNKKTQAAICTFFAVLPLINKIPGMKQISQSMATRLKDVIISNGVMEKEELEAMISIIQWDKQISEGVSKELVKRGTGVVEKHLIETAVKETEKKVAKSISLPSYDSVKKRIMKWVIKYFTSK